MKTLADEVRALMPAVVDHSIAGKCRLIHIIKESARNGDTAIGIKTGDRKIQDALITFASTSGFKSALMGNEVLISWGEMANLYRRWDVNSEWYFTAALVARAAAS